MLEERVEKVNKLIEDLGEDVNFSEYGDGVKEESIEKVENTLGFKLPETYKWFLKNYYGGEIYGEEVYYIDEEGTTNYGLDLLGHYNYNIREGLNKEYELVVSETDEVAFYYDIRDYERGYVELPIYSKYAKEGKYADDFIHFLERRIQE